MLACKFGFVASPASHPARMDGACTRGRVSTARFGGSGRVHVGRGRGDRGLRFEPVPTVASPPASPLPGEAPIWGWVPAGNDFADTRTRLPTLAFGRAVSRG
jgi:hypothetical protein